MWQVPRGTAQQTMKDTYFFSHDYSARNDPKLQEVLATYGVAGIGIYWCIIEQLYEQGGELPLKVRKTIAFILHCDVAMVESIVDDFGLFDNDGEVFWSESAKRRIDKMAETSAKRKMAIDKRWEKYKSNTSVIQEKNKTTTNKIKENKRDGFCPSLFVWCAKRESNPRPTYSEYATLSTELLARKHQYYTTNLGHL